MKSSKKCDNKGFTISELIVVLVIVSIAGILLFPLIKYSSKRMERTVCTNNMREIGLAFYIYAAEHGGNFPPSLKTLYDEKYLANKDLMDCPASKDKGTPENPDYIYTAGLSVRSPSNSVLAGDKKKNHSSGWKNVMEVSGKITGK